jgi:hypothetical protein
MIENLSGRTVRLFLVDGSPTGLLTAEIMNWTGHALICPRSRIGEALKRDEALRTGIYFLVGDDPDQPSKSKVYIGEGDNVADRIKTHSADDSKEFWTHACFITSKDQNLTKAHVRYLENRLVNLTKIADRANLANGNEPGKKSLPESDIADMEFFLSQVQLILPVVGFDFLRPKPSQNPKQLENILTATSAIPNSGSPNLELLLEGKKYGYLAHAIELDGEITVLKDSTAVGDVEFTQNSYAPLRSQLIQDGLLVKTETGLFKFAVDVNFRSPSAAAAVIKNRNTNGRKAWKIKGTNQTLKDWQDFQLLKAIP